MPIIQKETEAEFVAPLVGAWIEIKSYDEMSQSERVAPLVGAWIEMPWNMALKAQAESLLSWERGLKCYPNATTYTAGMVAPLVGAWIEIEKCEYTYKWTLSLLSWERGLKF